MNSNLYTTLLKELKTMRDQFRELVQRVEAFLLDNTETYVISLEQQATDHYLDMVQAQQDITDLQLQILESGV